MQILLLYLCAVSSQLGAVSTLSDVPGAADALQVIACAGARSSVSAESSVHLRTPGAGAQQVIIYIVSYGPGAWKS